MTDDGQSKARSIEVVLDIAASREDVWRALVDPVEVARWFAPAVEVTPGVGGRVAWSWDNAWFWISDIERWEPGSLLGLVNRDQRPYDVDGQLMPEGQVAPATLAMEFALTTIDGKTRLRLVHSGFGQGTAWDDEFDGVSVGWTFELRSLRHYLERFSGCNRAVASVRARTTHSQAEVWRQLVGEEGFAFDHWPVATGDRCRVVSAAGDRFEGEVLLHIPDRDLSLCAAELGGGIFRIGTYQGMGRTGVQVWLASHSPDAVDVLALGARCRQILDRLFPEGAP